MIINDTCLNAMKQMDPESIDCVITSPPYWQLRDYGYTEQWGLEPTYQEYLEHLWEWMDEVWRVLKPSGTCWINLGDTYGTKSGNMAPDHMTENKLKYVGGIKGYSKRKDLHKCLILIPHRFAIGCMDKGWIIRNDIVWAKINCMPESVRDRFSKKHEYLFFMVKSKDYYFDLDSIRDKQSDSSIKRATRKKTPQPGTMNRNGIRDFEKTRLKVLNGSGKNPGSVSDFWDIKTQPTKDKHYGMFGSKLIEKCILSGCPEGGVVLDPFCGTATTGVRSLQLGRKFVGVEASEEYYKIAQSNFSREQDQLKLF